MGQQKARGLVGRLLGQRDDATTDNGCCGPQLVSDDKAAEHATEPRTDDPTPASSQASATHPR
jgi:hypothetical protein